MSNDIVSKLEGCAFTGVSNQRVVSIGVSVLLAAAARIRELEAGVGMITPLPPECAPKGIPVLVAGGIAMKKTGGQWFTGMAEPAFERPIEWEVKWWSPIPQQNQPPARPRRDGGPT